MKLLYAVTHQARTDNECGQCRDKTVNRCLIKQQLIPTTMKKDKKLDTVKMAEAFAKQFADKHAWRKYPKYKRYTNK